MVGVQADFFDSLPFQGASLTGKADTGGPTVRQLGDSLLSFQRGLPEEELAQAGFAVDVMSWEAPSDVSLTKSSLLSSSSSINESSSHSTITRCLSLSTETG
jgi:hypothetical protein